MTTTHTLPPRQGRSALVGLLLALHGTDESPRRPRWGALSRAGAIARPAGIRRRHLRTSADRATGAARCSGWQDGTTWSRSRSAIPEEEELPSVGVLRLVDPETGRQLQWTRRAIVCVSGTRRRPPPSDRIWRAPSPGSVSVTWCSRPPATGCERSPPSCARGRAGDELRISALPPRLAGRACGRRPLRRAPPPRSRWPRSSPHCFQTSSTRSLAGCGTCRRRSCSSRSRRCSSPSRGRGPDLGTPRERDDHARHRHRSMAAKDVLRAWKPREVDPRVPREGARHVPRRRRLLRERRPRRGAADATASSSSWRCASFVSARARRSVTRSPRRSRSARRPAGQAPTRADADDRLAHLRRQGGRWDISPQQASQTAVARGVPINTVAWYCDGVVEVPLAGGYTARVQVPPDRIRCVRSRRRPAAGSSVADGRAARRCTPISHPAR